MVFLLIFLVACVAPDLAYNPPPSEGASVYYEEGLPEAWQPPVCQASSEDWRECVLEEAHAPPAEADGFMPFGSPRAGTVVEWQGLSWLVTTEPWSFGVRCVALHADDPVCPWDFSDFADKSLVTPVRVGETLILTTVDSSPSMALAPTMAREGDDGAAFDRPVSLVAHEFSLATGEARFIGTIEGESPSCLPYGLAPVDLRGDGSSELVYRFVGQGSCPIPYLEQENGAWVQKLLPHASGGAQYGIYGFWLGDDRFWVLGDIRDQSCFIGSSLIEASPIPCPVMARDWMGLALIDEGVGRPSLLTPDIGGLGLCRFMSEEYSLDSCYESGQASGFPSDDLGADQGWSTHWDIVVADLDGDEVPEVYEARSYDSPDETWDQNLGAWRLGGDLMWSPIEDSVFETPAHERGLGLWAPPGFGDPVLIPMPVSGVSSLRMLAPPLSERGRVQTRIVNRIGEPDCGARATVIYESGEERQFFPFCTNGGGLQVPAAVFTPPDATLRIKWSDGTDHEAQVGGIAAP